MADITRRGETKQHAKRIFSVDSQPIAFGMILPKLIVVFYRRLAT